MIIGEKVLGVALRRTRVSDDEWLVLLEERRRVVRPMLKQIACAKLGDTRYTAPGIDFTLTRFVEGLRSCTGDAALQMRGAFGIARRRTRADDDRRLHAFGLTRNDTWVYAVLDISPDESGTLTVHSLVMPDDFVRLDLTYRRLFNLLGTAVEKWMRRREKRFKQAEDLHRRFAIEREILDHLWAEHEKD